MAKAAKLTKVADSTGRGKNFLPGPGAGNTIPNGGGDRGPKAQKARNSGKELSKAIGGPNFSPQKSVPTDLTQK